MKNPPLKDIIQALQEKSQRVIVCSHVNPDGDAIGSQVALTRCLNALGVDAVILKSSDTPEILQDFLQDTPFISDKEQISPCVAVAVDCSDEQRIAEHLELGAFFLNIDHHVSNTQFGTFNLVDPSSAATCELLAAAFYNEHLPFDKISAEALLMGIMTDTGNFIFNNTSANTLFLAGKLIEDYGLLPSEIAGRIYNQNPFRRIEFLSFFLSRIRLALNGQVAMVVLEEKDYLKFGTTHADTEGFITYLLSIKGVKIAVFLDQQAGFIKGSLRSISANFNVHYLATIWGGGGHACAAGFKVHDKPIEIFSKELLNELEKTFLR